MKKKTNAGIKRLIKDIKKSVKSGTKTTWNGLRLDIDYNTRDMGEEAVKDGAHRAQEYFGGGDAKRQRNNK